jgi:hypothetical protein
MPYKFDILIYQKINEPKLKEHIDRVQAEFYSYRTSTVFIKVMVCVFNIL